MSRTVPPPGNLFAGVARLIFFNASGFAAIGNTRQAFLSSLSPLVAFLIVGSMLEALTSGWRLGAADALQTLCILVGQPVMSHLVATWWKRESYWLRYATAMNWCQLAIPAVAFVFTLVAIFAGGTGPSPRSLAFGLLGMVFIYAVLLNGFLAWRGLNLTLWRAAAFVIIVTGALALLLSIPIGINLALHGHSPPAVQT